MCRDRFTFHRCHLPASIILVDAVVGRRRCPGRSSSPRRGRGGASKDRENQRSRDVCPTRMHVDHQRPTFSPKFRGHNKTTVFPAGRTAILYRPPPPPLSLSLRSPSRSLLVCPSLAPSWPSFSRLSRATRIRKNQCDVTCALPTPPDLSCVPTEQLSLSPFSLLPESKLKTSSLLSSFFPSKYINSRI